MRPRTVLGALVTLLVIAACALVWYDLPDNTEIYAPFDVDGTIGAPVSGRGVTATVTDVQIAPRAVVEVSDKVIMANGVWVVPALRWQATDDYGLGHVDLQIGPNTYTSTDRLLGSSSGLQPGIEQRQALVFDVAPEILDTVDSMVLRVWVGDPRLDSRLLIDLPLHDQRVVRKDSATVPATVSAAT